MTAIGEGGSLICFPAARYGREHDELIIEWK
jgi:hypothetical protein